MGGADVDTGTDADADTGLRGLTGRNRAARIGLFLALGSLGFLGNFAGPIAWLNPVLFALLALLCALLAIPFGHAGRFRARRLGGEGRGAALAAVLIGWLCLLVLLLAGAAALLLGLSLGALLEHG
ncbi:hypothetical protein OOK31_32190 [Streptomyces sp. NBC_00249]|uniref:hypothetical protein n=1 Tax=Streptomyces sp. NBC_00249 TaxID=2975690 RepID=UPI0022577A17|nr:hypothetical protein [Streptomyces sp. NBC_00249]MCX5198492.1 hypothetical protein [Streptomyces sp. NBC_00249]